MDWVLPFYDLQRDLMAADELAIVHAERLATLAARAVAPPAHLLELGAGRGGFAAAACHAGHRVTAVELVPALASDAARALAAPSLGGRGRAICGDFYAVELDQRFDAVCYWDGFGVGGDADQARLLARIAGWLASGARAFVDVYTPWYWAAAAGQAMTVGDASRRYDFDARGCRMLDTWWPTDDPTRARTQSLRCYGPADLELLLGPAGLALVDVEAGGAPDPATGQWRARVPLREAMTFVAIVGAA